MNRRTYWVRLLIVPCALLFVLGCELDETLTIHADGSGTYVLRIAVEKQLGEVILKMKKDAEKRGYRVVEETETADRKVLAIRRDFRDVAELNDNTDTYVLRIDRSRKWRPTYSLTVSSSASAGSNGFQKRTTTILMPAGVTSASTGAVHGRRVEWDATGGGTLQIEAAGLAWPFGMPPLVAIAIVALLGIGLAVAARRKAPRVAVLGMALLAVIGFAATNASQGFGSVTPARLLGSLLGAKTNPLVGQWQCVKTVMRYRDGTETTTTEFPYRLYRTFSDDESWELSRVQADRPTWRSRGRFTMVDASHFVSEITEHDQLQYVGKKFTAEFRRNSDELTLVTTPVEGDSPKLPKMTEMTFVAKRGALE